MIHNEATNNQMHNQIYNEQPENNQPLRTLIVDDEAAQRRSIKAKLSAHCADIATVVGEAHSVFQAIDSITATEPDVVLLDIQMPDGTGFDVLDAFEEPTFAVIFVTGFREFAVDAFEYQALDYLLKPVDGQRLRTAMERVITAHRPFIRVPTAGANPPQPPAVAAAATLDRIAIRTAQAKKVIELQHILYCSADRHHCIFTMTDTTTEHILQPLKDFEERLMKNGFIRINRSQCINKRYVAEIKAKRKGCTVVMNDTQRTELQVAESHRVALRHSF